MREVAGRGDTLKPVVVRATGNGRFMIVDGVHTWRAAVAAGLDEVPVEVVEVDDFEARRQTFVRNKHGSTNPVRLGRMSQWMREFRGLTNTELAVEFAVSEGTVRNMQLYAEAADRWPEREAEIAKMSVKQVRDLLSDKEEKTGRAAGARRSSPASATPPRPRSAAWKLAGAAARPCSSGCSADSGSSL